MCDRCESIETEISYREFMLYAARQLAKDLIDTDQFQAARIVHAAEEELKEADIARREHLSKDHHHWWQIGKRDTA